MFLLRCLKQLVILSLVIISMACNSTRNRAPIVEGNSTGTQHFKLNRAPSSPAIDTSSDHQRRGFYVLMGQSNMTGYGDLDELPNNFPKNGSHLFNFSNTGAIEYAQEPIDSGVNEVYSVAQDFVAGVGPGLSFADTLYDYYPYMDIGLIPCAKGGSTMDEWFPSRSTDTLYGACLVRIQDAMKHSEFLGVLWYQGESDTVEIELAESWPAKFENVIATLRQDTEMSELPVCFAQLAVVGVQQQRALVLLYWDYLKQLQEVLAVNLQDDYVTMIRTDDLSVRDDGLHLDTASELEVGRRFAAEMAYYLTNGHY